MSCYQVVMARTVESLTDALFSLDEPWRSRFLTLVATRATRWAWDEQSPTHDQVAVWLGDRSLFREVSLLLDTWNGSRP